MIAINSTENGLLIWLDSSYKEIYKKDRFLLYSNDSPFLLGLSPTTRALYNYYDLQLSTRYCNYSAALHVTNICISAREQISTRVFTFYWKRYIYSSHHGMLSPIFIQASAGDCLRSIYLSLCGMLCPIYLDFILKYISSLDQAYISSAPEHAI